ncbi:aminotransferase class V-fold PLP-dependent enzyme [Streptomyces sp. ISL-11]|uniref:pyridoxal phosphate-dependent decarboxylase family protein n=1 Tax=Streptomyces sp. ISL-11 TaxID=2819174 RepID=UPI001BE833CA|nr:aminotransferase class V-fold PLP-dependent enzyme [Streptomyces sp. ISL-11]MBT2385055.1 aminotransferase class V-fold PLP-dependent enzyme [Streptomyces sp. ISL-11]
MSAPDTAPPTASDTPPHSPPPAPDTAPLAGGTHGPHALRPLLDTALDALTQGATARAGPLPAGGPDLVTARLRAAVGPVLPETGTGEHDALHTLVRALAEGSADPADPHCAAHLHCPPLAVATAADLAASALNPSLDSWDQAPAASALETLTTQALAALAYPTRPAPDALVTTGGTESNQLALLLAREAAPWPLQIICGANAHHSIHRAAWLLGLPQPHTLPTPTGVIDPTDLKTALTALRNIPTLVVATAGTTDTGQIDPLTDIADLCTTHHTPLHIDASYGGPLLFSDTLRPALDGLDRAHTIALDLHKLGWQPIAAGLLAVPRTTDLHPLAARADYLNATDDTEAGLPDLLGRSLRTTRRADILKIAVTLRALGRRGIATLVEQVCATAHRLADLIEAHPRFDLYARPTVSTVLFRPTRTDDHTTAHIRRQLLHTGHAALGRATTPDGLWLKATLLNPHTTTEDLRTLLTLVEGHTTP